MHSKNKDTNEICIVTPWPPQKSGIADYAYTLAQSLIQANYKVNIITNCDAPVVLSGCNIKTISNQEDLLYELRKHSMPLFQLGNHPAFHDYMPDVISSLGAACFVELHDVALHHLVAGHTGARNESSHYASWLRHNYGNDTCSRLLSAPSEAVDFLTFPCSEIILGGCAGVIVHSEFAKSLLINAGLLSPIWVVDLIIDPFSTISNTPSKKDSILKIGVFGGVQKNRRIDWIINTIANLDQDIQQNIALDIYGEIDEDCIYLQNLSASMNSKSSVKFHGRVDLDQFNAALQSTDLCVALRSPTMGETSAVVSKALSAGIPLVTSNIGWYSELPPPIIKIDNNRAMTELGNLIKNLYQDKGKYELLKKNSIQLAQEFTSLPRVADDLISIKKYLT